MELLKQLYILLGITFLISCGNEHSKKDFIFENYNYVTAASDTVKAINIGWEFVNERNAINLNAVKHECVDETNAAVKLYGKIIKINHDTITIETTDGNLQGKLNFELPKQVNLLNQFCFIQGIIQVHPEIEFIIEGLLVQNRQIQAN